MNDILPVECIDHDDIVENTEGFNSKINPSSSIDWPGINPETMPPILGYNLTRAKNGSEVLLSVEQTGDPLLAHGKFGKGRTLAYMSDPAPHWGCNFVFWEHYNQFWLACMDLLLSEQKNY